MARRKKSNKSKKKSIEKKESKSESIDNKETKHSYEIIKDLNKQYRKGSYISKEEYDRRSKYTDIDEYVKK